MRNVLSVLPSSGIDAVPERLVALEAAEVLEEPIERMAEQAGFVARRSFKAHFRVDRSD